MRLVHLLCFALLASCAARQATPPVVVQVALVAPPPSRASPDVTVDRLPEMTRLSGVWFEGGAVSSALSTFLWNRESGRPRVEFHGNTAVREAHARQPDGDGGYHLALRIDPVRGNSTSQGWVSVTFSTQPRSRGWVNDPDAAPGLLVRSNGSLELAWRGTGVAVRWETSPPAPASAYDLELHLRAEGSALRLSGQCNGARFTAEMPPGSALPPALYVQFGAHFHPGDAQESWLEWS